MCTYFRNSSAMSDVTCARSSNRAASVPKRFRNVFAAALSDFSWIHQKLNNHGIRGRAMNARSRYYIAAPTH